MNKTLITIAGIGLLSALLTYPALAHNPKGYSRGHHMGPGYHMGSGSQHGPWAGYDTLTEEQRGNIDQLTDGFVAETKEIREQLRQKSAELNALLSSPEPDEAKAQEIQKELNTQRNTLAEKRLELNLKVRQIAPEALSQNPFCAGPGGGHRYMPW